MFDNTFPALLNKLQTVDYIFFDGNHTYDSTIKYFETALHTFTTKPFLYSMILIGRTESQRAWKEICAHSSTTLCIDIFMMGIVLFDTSLAKQTFVLPVLIFFIGWIVRKKPARFLETCGFEMIAENTEPSPL